MHTLGLLILRVGMFLNGCREDSKCPCENKSERKILKLL